MRHSFLLFSVVALAGCGEPGPEATAPRSPAELKATIQTVAEFDQPGEVAYGFGSIWAADPSGRVLRIDPRSGEIQARIRVANQGRVSAGGDGMWLSDFGADRVRRIDPSSNRVVATIRVGKAPSAVMPDEGGAWVALHHGNGVERIEDDRVTMRARASRLEIVNGGPQGVASAAGRIWTGVPVLEQVIPVDPATGQAGKPVETSQEPCGALAGAGDDLWVSPGGCGFRLMHVDARAGREVAVHQLSNAQVGDPVIHGGALWVTTTDGLLHKLDPRTGRALARARIGREAMSVAVVDEGLVFVSGMRVQRVMLGE